MRIYLLSFIAAIFICFAVSAVSNLMLAWAGDELELVEDTKTLFSSILAGGSLFGILLVVPIFSSLLPASVLTLERSDRSSQFPACLPPTRLQIYLSKLIVIAVVVFSGLFSRICAGEKVSGTVLTPFLPHSRVLQSARPQARRR